MYQWSRIRILALHRYCAFVKRRFTERGTTIGSCTETLRHEPGLVGRNYYAGSVFPPLQQMLVTRVGAVRARMCILSGCTLYHG